MDSRPLLNKLKKVGILIDSKSFEESLNNNERSSFALLTYFDKSCITCIRSPFSSTHEELTAIPEYQLIVPKKGLSPSNPCGSIKYESIFGETVWGFDYHYESIERLAKQILKKESVSEDEINLINLIFILATFNGYSSYNRVRNEIFLLITESELLLKKRLWLESNFPSIQLNIMTIEETSFFLDFFFKKNGLYLARGNHSFNKGFWYWNSLRLKLPHFNTGEPIIAALANRIEYALMALDEIGIQYYKGVDNDTQANMLYHFNYLISLISGIFDNLAIKTNDYYGINFQYSNQISLSSNNGRSFLKQIKEKNPKLRALIQKYVFLINVVYLFRELIIHRQGFEKSAFHYVSHNGSWQANMISISKDIVSEINLCGDKKSKYDEISNWGVYPQGNESFLEPFHFSLEVLKKLIPFVDEYLELLHYSSFIEEQQKNKSDFYLTMKVFEDNHLGF